MNRPARRPTTWVLAMMAGLLASACAPEDEAPHQASAEVYARGFCEQYCGKHDECAPVPETFPPCNVEECVGRYMNTLDEPCKLERTEFGRCLLERESCEEFFDIVVDDTVDSVCYDWVQISYSCTLQMGSPDYSESGADTQ